jgi:hypothetical protein
MFEDLLPEESEEFVFKPDRIIRSRRMQQKKNHIAKQVKIKTDITPWLSVDSPHRFHKTKSMNCGDPNCAMCGNPRKFWGEVTIQERRFFNGECCDNQ